VKDQDEEQPKKNKARKNAYKVTRVMRRKAYYSARPMFTLANKKRTLARHIRHFPEDTQACGIYEKAYGLGALQGQKEKMIGKAKKRLKPVKQVKKSRRVTP
jgi:hypothetical protein